MCCCRAAAKPSGVRPGRLHCKQPALLQAGPGLLRLLGIVLLQLLCGLASAELHDVLLS